MTAQDIEKLKAFCDEKGIEMIPTADRDVWEFKSKDIWDGVEYAKGLYSGSIYRIVDNHLFNISIQTDSGTDVGLKKNYTPSTESEYIEQLTCKAKEWYGEIRKGDVFDQSPFNEDKGKFKVERDQIKFSYDKWSDSLYVNGVTLYRGGKWATRIEEPIKANITSFTLSNPYSTIVFTTSHRIKEGQVDAKEFMNHIEESMEAFLNRKP